MNGNGKLVWTLIDGGLVFRGMGGDGEPLAPARWALYDLVSVDKRKISVAPLLALIEDGLVETGTDMSVFVPHALVASFDEKEASQLGLPVAAPVRLKMSGKGILTSPQFRFQYQLLKADGTPVMATGRTGSLLNWGTRQYSLHEPLYSLIEGMEQFNATPPSDMDARMLRWADMKPLLPPDAVVDENLRSMNIVRADSFTLDVDDSGNFTPQLLHKPVRPETEDGLDSPPRGEPAIPAAPQKEFQARFHAQPKARRYYTAAGGWFIVVPERLRKALDIVREKQDAPDAERRAFIANPAGVLKDRLQDELGEDVLDELFEETPEFLSARISHLGVWVPKQNIYIRGSGQNWIADDVDTFGVMIGESIINVAPADVEKLYADLLQAKAQEASAVAYNDQHVPVTEESVSTFGRLHAAIQEATAEKEPEKQGARAEEEKKVPILIDNVEELGYVGSPRPYRGEPGGFPAVLKTTTLYPHQKEGLKWLQEHWAFGSTGALLADDMGLGKTLQTLSFMAWVQEQMDAGHHPRKPLLIVAPTGLLKNWEDEAGIHLVSPGLGKLFRAFGAGLNELKGLTHNQRTEKIASFDWVLTTYETLRDKISYFLPVEWALVAFDEVQKIKNPASRTTEMAKGIEADFFLALTGTPVENRLGDLWSIIDTVAPGSLGSLRDFVKRYEPEEGPGDAIEDLRHALMEEPKPVRLLRRMKTDHLKGLPEKNEHIIRVAMPPAQANAYDAVVAPVKAGLKGSLDILGVLQELRQVSLLPEPLGEDGITDEVVATSARLSALVQTLDEINARNEKALVFLEFLAVQDALIPYLQARYRMPRPPLRISGGVAGHVRKKHVDEFQSQPAGEFDVMLLSPKAGGVGLTLTAANNVIHLSRWWNPAVEDQCTDRVFRIGQTRPVNVYCPLAIHPLLRDASFDVNLHHLLETKRSLSRQLFAAPIANAEELEGLLNASV